MAVTKQFTGKPLQVSETPENRQRIDAIAEAENISQAQVVRELIAYGLKWRESLTARRVADKKKAATKKGATRG